MSLMAEDLENLDSVPPPPVEEASATEESALVTEVAGVEGVVQRLTEKGLPVFARTVRDVSGVASRTETSAAQLAFIITQDANMAARLLKVANSAVLNPNKRVINTLSRAVVLMGFTAVKSIAMSLALIENLLQGKQRDLIAKNMARSFHAATQAKTFAEKRKDSCPEEVFVATLLFHIGELAFWASGETKVQELRSFMESHPMMDAKKAQKTVLGFELKQLTKSLADEWSLGSLLQGAVREDDSNPRISNISLGNELAETVEASGWNSPATKKLIARIAETLYLPLDTVTAMVQENADAAAKIAAGYGVGSLGKFIPGAKYSSEGPRADAGGDYATANAGGEEFDAPGGAQGADFALMDGESAFKLPNPMVQLKLLRELSEHIEGTPNLNKLIQMVLEGIYEGIGTDRTFFALLNPKRTLLKAKYALGWDQQKILHTFLIEVGSGQNNLFRLILERV